MKKSYQHTRWLRSFGQHGPLGYFTGESSTGLFYTEENVLIDRVQRTMFLPPAPQEGKHQGGDRTEDKHMPDTTAVRCCRV